MINFDLNYDFKEFDALSSIFQQFSQAAFPNLAATTENAAKKVSQAWKNFLSGEEVLDIKLPENAKVNGKMIQSVKTDTDDGLHWEVHSENEQMQKLAQGTPDEQYDMKRTHPYGRKSRVSSKGVPYLIIPFRWGTPNGKGTKRRWNNVIPQKQYETKLKEFEISRFVKKNGRWTHPEPNFKGEDIERKNYIWKSRLKEEDAWDDRSTGMVRMKDDTKSTYFTFRIVSAKSPASSWWYKKQGSEGIDIIGALHRKFDASIENALNQALAEDEKWLKGQFD